VRLSGADRKRLAAALETAGEARVYRRVEALLLVTQGQTVAEAARCCHVDRSSVHRWLGQYGARRDATALAIGREWPAAAEQPAHAAAAGGGAGP
jgi:transposase